jgi:hypothetical protein
MKVREFFEKDQPGAQSHRPPGIMVEARIGQPWKKL